MTHLGRAASIQKRHFLHANRDDWNLRDCDELFSTRQQVKWIKRSIAYERANFFSV